MTDQKLPNKKILYTIASIVVLVGIFGAGIAVGYTNRPFVDRVVTVSNKETTPQVKADFSPFWKAWSLINEKYPSPGDATDQERVWGAISGMVASLEDPYSVFLSPEENKQFHETISGTFGGVGIEIGEKDNILTVVAPLPGTPAQKADMKAGDKILKINDTITSDITIDEAIDLIRGEIGTTVLLTVLPADKNVPREVALVRSLIQVPTLETKLLENGIFVIELYSFSENSPAVFRDALREFQSSGSNKLIIDLRNNPGGYLDASVEIAGWFLAPGKVIVQEEMRSPKEKITYRSPGPGIFSSSNIVILVNGGSASASEILAGALQEHNAATVVGTKTYGKGSVQELVPITSDTSLKITVAKWLTPNGVSISDHGLTPDFVVEITEEDFLAQRDPQLEKAQQLLNTR